MAISLLKEKVVEPGSFALLKFFDFKRKKGEREKRKQEKKREK